MDANQISKRCNIKITRTKQVPDKSFIDNLNIRN